MDIRRVLRFEKCEQRIVLDGAALSVNAIDFVPNDTEAEVQVWVDGNVEVADFSSQLPFGKDNTFSLESNPSSTKTIYLDFDGHHSQNNLWGHDITFPAFDLDGDSSTFTDSELAEIQQQFLRVAEDYLAFDVNVTTKDPGVEALRQSGADDNHWGVRSVNTQYTDGFGNGTDGIAHLNSFSECVDDPVFVFSKGAVAGGMTNSREVGLAVFGLAADDFFPNQTNSPENGETELGTPPNKNQSVSSSEFKGGDVNNVAVTDSTDLNGISIPVQNDEFTDVSPVPDVVRQAADESIELPSDDDANSDLSESAKLVLDPTGQRDPDPSDDPETEDDYPTLFECIEKDEFNLAIMYWYE